MNTRDIAGEDVTAGDVAMLVGFLRDRHQPASVEVEIYHRDDDDLSSRPGPCPEPNPRYPSDPCPGHMEEILYCVECGMGDSGFGDLAYLEWPCATIRALDQYEAGQSGRQLQSEDDG